jgi:hypothetical protein
MVQHSLDLVDLDADASLPDQAAAVTAACGRYGVAVHSTFTGLGAYGRNLLLDPDAGSRRRARLWLRRAVDFTALVGGRACGGQVGALSVAEVESLLAPADAAHAAVALCLDIGHQCVVGTAGDDRDPYAWLRRLGAHAPVVHLQQSDADADHHWPFTAERNAQGRIAADRVLDALDASGARAVALVLEVIPSFEQDDDQVVAELVESAAYWRGALARRR